MTDHEHDHNCDCGCKELEEIEILTLVDEEGEEHEFEFVAELEVDGNEYRVLMPLEELEEDDEEFEAELVILKVVAGEDGTEMMVDIEDDEEWEKVADAWQELTGDEDDD